MSSDRHLRPGTPRLLLVIGVIVLLAAVVFWRQRSQRLVRAETTSAQDAQLAPGNERKLYAELAQQQQARAARSLKPTVTHEMGDVGGKFFGQIPDPARTRHYYIAAEPEQWDYMPSGSDPVCGMALPPDVIMRHQIWKVRYIQYTDATFTKRVPQPARLGILGPVLRGVTGEFLAVTFYNRTQEPLSMHPHGVKYDKDSEGSYHNEIDDGSRSPQPRANDAHSSIQGKGAAVGYNAKFTYVWQLDEESGPLPSEPSSKAWLYHSHVNTEIEINQGLEGFIIVTDPKRARADGTPSDVDREMAALFMIYDENPLGPEAQETLLTTSSDQLTSTWVNLQQLIEQSERHAINGYIFGNLPGLELNEGERVRWYLFGLGSEKDFHTAHWHGLRVIEDGRRRTDVVELLPATMKVADMLADDPGDWLFHCHVEEHMANGMFARVTVRPKGGPEVSRAPEDAFFGLPKARP